MAPDLVVTVCDRAYEELEPLEATQLHWSIPDPAEIGSPEAFERTFQLLNHRIALLSKTAITD
jgi:protein-tyrosine-phosphatase